jgi:hypothetical protein
MMERFEKQTSNYIIVSTSHGRMIQLVVGIHDTVNALQELVTKKTGISGFCQQLTYCGRNLTSRFTLSQFNIRQHSTVQMTTPVNGGNLE